MAAAGISDLGTNSQQVQNELDHLAKHHLVVRIDNDGQVKDKSRNLYQKDKTVRAIKERLINLADNRSAREGMPTKRKPASQERVTVQRATREVLRKKKHLKILYLVASPEEKAPLRVDAEIRKVQEAIRGSAFRNNITIEFRPAADLDSLIDGLNDHRPQIIHFSGHGSNIGLLTDSGTVGKAAGKTLPYELLAKALASTDAPAKVIVLNSCHSSTAKKFLVASDRIVITMRTSVTDIAATAFAQRFYAAIAAGQSVGSAFEQGKLAVMAVSLTEMDTPELLYTPGTSPSKLVLT